MEKKYYVYFHINPLKNEIFYVGKGYGGRAYDKKTGRSKWWKDTINKYGLIIDIVEDGLTNDEAIEREIWYIAKLGRKDLGLGPLVNMTDGGEGASGYKHTSESLEKMSLVHKGRIYITGTRQTDETKRKISEAKKGQISWNKGISPSDETKMKLSVINKGNKYALGNTHSDEAKEKIKEARKRQTPPNLGRKMSEETKRKISETKKKRNE